jgi:hypothetical protein
VLSLENVVEEESMAEPEAEVEATFEAEVVRKAMRKYEEFHQLAAGTAEYDEVARSSAGIEGWANYGHPTPAKRRNEGEAERASKIQRVIDWSQADIRDGAAAAARSMQEQKQEQERNDNIKRWSSRVIVKGLPYWATEDYLLNVFQNYGNVKKMKMIWTDNLGRTLNSPYGFVCFSNPDGAKMCLEASIQLVPGVPLRVELNVPEVWVGKLEPHRIIEGEKSDLCAHFANYGKVKELKIKGSHAVLSFCSMDDTATVLGLRKTTMNDGTILQITDRDEEITNRPVMTSSHATSGTKKSVLCRYWGAGWCDRGSSCWFLHPNGWNGPS